jgi:hypothetical protein
MIDQMLVQHLQHFSSGTGTELKRLAYMSLINNGANIGQFPVNRYLDETQSVPNAPLSTVKKSAKIKQAMATESSPETKRASSETPEIFATRGHKETGEIAKAHTVESISVTVIEQDPLRTGPVIHDGLEDDLFNLR